MALTPARASAEETDGPVSPWIAAAAWLVLQAVPSPMLVYGSGDVHAGMRWQVTPLSLSWGVAKGPVRAFLVEPIARHSGSIELYASPEIMGGAPSGGTPWVLRAGSRAYFPLRGRGESMSWSLGGSYYRAAGGDGFAADLGVYAFFGIFGLTVTVAPEMRRREIILALNFRYF